MGHHSAIPFEQRVAFHEAVADRSAYVAWIDANNEVTRQKHSTAADAVNTNLAYMIRPRPGITPLDFDTDASLWPQDGITRAMTLERYLTKEGLLCVVLKSGGNGCAHLWTALTDEQAKDHAPLIKRLGGDNRTISGIRPPFAPHRSGRQMVLIRPATLASALGILAPVPNADVDRKSDAKLYELLNETGKPDRSGHIFKIAGYYKSRGYSCESFVRDVLDHPQGAGHKLFYTKGGIWNPRSDCRTYLEKAYREASPPAMRPEDREKVTAEIDLIRAAVYRDGCISGGTKLLPSFDCLLSVAECPAYSTTISMSCRQLGEAACISTKTAARHLELLCVEGWLERVDVARINRGARYRLTIRIRMSRFDTLSIHPLPCQESVGVCHTDASSLQKTLEALARLPALRHAIICMSRLPATFNAEELAAASSRSVPASRTSLRKLAALGLARRVSGHVWTATINEVSVRNVASMRGTVGLQSRIKTQNDEERASFRINVGRMAA